MCKVSEDLDFFLGGFGEVFWKYLDVFGWIGDGFGCIWLDSGWVLMDGTGSGRPKPLKYAYNSLSKFTFSSSANHV